MKCKKTPLAALVATSLYAASASAVLLTDPNDPRNWQGATVGTFAQLVYGADTATNRQQVINDQLLDDSVFDPSGYVTGTLMNTTWSTAAGAGGCKGTSTDLTGTGRYTYSCNGTSVFDNANSIDNTWFQSSGTIGDTVFDLGFNATKAAVFNSIDHGPLPSEGIESTVYLSNDRVNWTQAVLERVWLEGFMPNTDIKWDGFVYAVGTGTNDTFRYASVIWGGPGALRRDGDDEINGIMGLRGDYTPKPTPAPGLFALLSLGLAGIFARRRLVRR